MSKKNFDYFDSFKKMIEGTMAASRLLDEIINNYKASDLLLLSLIHI